MKNKFFTKDGWLTRYAMACGYRHESQIGPKHIIFSENNRETNNYQIQVFDSRDYNKKEWIVTEGIVAAKRIYKEKCQGSPAKRFESNQDVNRIVYA